ncbi:hypothetical protein ACTUSO_10670 [Pantoea ananatis]|uniref:hypothetical protein n=1 Tax=Pantoea ananas TaxID=553 RepID=UPI003FA4B0A2
MGEKTVMAQNNFKPFAIGNGANVLSQADYEALGALLSGFQSGKASSAQINKALRQSTVMSSVIAQFVANVSGQDVLDNGDTGTLLNNLLVAVQLTAKNTSIPLMTGVVGMARNLVMNVAAASSTVNITADEIIVDTALGGNQYRIGSFNKTVNLSTIGAGGMDTGAPPVSGYVGIYAILNPSSGASALLAVNATAAVLPEVYSGANMPAGYTASALLSVVPTDSNGKIIALYQQGRNVLLPTTQIASTTSFINTPTAVSLSSIVPKNCKTIDGILFVTSGNSIRPTLRLQSLPNVDNGMKQIVSGTNSSYNSLQAPFSNLVVVNSQTLYWSITKGDSGDTLASAYAYLTSYTF